ncbi:30S ribosomal protein S20 [Candidatus Peregrinibacteria bacterium]|nr:30S ribosomal protein S20 [Candidatus Peregrinibacteria bacterium]
MPVIKSAKKQMRQALKRRARNAPLRNEVKTVFKKQLKFITEGKTDEAVKFMPTVFSVIDMALKKNLLHRNNAANKKSRLALALSKLQKSGEKVAKSEAKV